MATTAASIDVYQVIADALVEECGVPRESITPDANLAEDLGLDSLAVVDLCYSLDVQLGIKIPFEDLLNNINSGNLDPKEAFLMKSMVAAVQELIDATKA